MVFLNDQSSPTTVTTNYTKLIAQQKVNFVFGPFSTLLTVPAAKVAARYGYAFPEGAGGGPAVYALNLPNLFAVSPPVARPAGAVRRLGGRAARQRAARRRPPTRW